MDDPPVNNSNLLINEPIDGCSSERRHAAAGASVSAPGLRGIVELTVTEQQQLLSSRHRKVLISVALKSD